MIPTGGMLTNVQNVDIQRQPSRTYKLDMNKQRIVGMIDGMDAVKQAVFKILQTKRFAYLIYSFNYGFENVIGTDPIIFQSEQRRKLEEALKQDDRIKSIEDLEITFEGDAAYLQMTVVSVYGNFKVAQEVNTHV